MKMRKWRTRLALVGFFGLATVLYLGALRTAQPAAPHPWFAMRPGEHTPLVFAHQGGEEIRPSNTLLAFQHAVDLGVDVLDTDMHRTKDGVLVLIHDETVDRTTNGTGAIRDLTLAELQSLDAAYWFSPDADTTFSYRDQGIRVPTLEEAFLAFPNQRFGIEIKQTSPEVVTPFCALIRQHDMQAKVLVSSFSQTNMDAFRAACPEVATSATAAEVRTFFILSTLRLSAAFSPRYHSLQIPEQYGRIRLLTPHFIDAAHRRGLAVQPWTINEPDDLQRVLTLGVDGINTDYPDRLLALLTNKTQ